MREKARVKVGEWSDEETSRSTHPTGLPATDSRAATDFPSPRYYDISLSKYVAAQTMPRGLVNQFGSIGFDALADDICWVHQGHTIIGLVRLMKQRTEGASGH